MRHDTPVKRVGASVGSGRFGRPKTKSLAPPYWSTPCSKSFCKPSSQTPLAEDRYLVLADWLEEHDDPRRAELLRLHRRLLATCCEPDAHPERAAWQARGRGAARGRA